MDTLLRHVTIRNFSSKPVSEELLVKILTAGTRASTTGNMQWYSIIITRDTVRKSLLDGLHFNQKPAVTAPVNLTFCADINRFSHWCRINKAVPAYDNFLSFFNAATDAILAAQNVCVAAESYGLGICYLGTALYNASGIIELLEIPEGVMPVTSVAIGWPAEVPALTDRLPLQAVIHNEVYKDYTDDAIDEFFAFKENLAESGKFVTENNKETLAQVFTDIRYKKADNEHYSGKLVNTLRKQGFIR
jgi:nitroreductase